MKWNSTPVIALVAVVVFAAAAALLVFSRSDDPTPSARPTSPVDAPSPSAFGDPPRLGDAVLDVSPAHAEPIDQADTRPEFPIRAPAGLCATVSFEDTPETLRWFHLWFDGDLVTPSTTVFPTAEEVDGIPVGADICYMPDEGLPVGVHTAAVTVSDPTVPNPIARQVVTWGFEVR